MVSARTLRLLPFLALFWTTPIVLAEECDCDISLPANAAGAATKPKVLLAGIGGWKSCLGKTANDQYISNRFLKLVENLRRCRPDWDVSYVMFCSPGLKTAKFDGQVRYYGRFGAGMVAEQDIGACIVRHKKTPDSKVFVMGHSHGGWMAMRATLCIGRVDGLFSMEPVSAAECDTRAYLKNRRRKIFKSRQKIVPGCRRAPTDVDHQAVWAACGGNWTNFFLAPNTEKGNVYSSPIAIANNVMIWAPAQGKFNAHHNLGLSARTWSVIENGILDSLSQQMSFLPNIGPGSPNTMVPLPAPLLPATPLPGTSSESHYVDPQASIQPKTTARAESPAEFVAHEFPEMRTWWNADRTQSRQGYLVDFQAGKVIIELPDGNRKSTSLIALSKEDRAWLSSHQVPLFGN